MINYVICSYWNCAMIVFDLVFSFDEKEPENIIKTIKEEMEKAYPDYSFFVILDRDYSLS